MGQIRAKIITPDNEFADRYVTLYTEGGGESVDIIDNLESERTDAALSAKQGKVLNETKYSLPENGIPASDLSASVQTSLGKADSALQEHQSLSAYRTSAAQDTIDAGKLSNPSGGTTGQVLTKTATGTEWSSVSGGMSDDEKLISASAFDDLDERLVSVEYGWEKRESGVVRTIVNTDVTDNLTSPYKQKPLSANQGYSLKKMSDENEDTVAASLCDLAFDRLPSSVIAEGYKAYKTYALDDYCTENNTLFRCTTPVTQAEFFDAEKWTQTTVMDEIIRLITNLNS